MKARRNSEPCILALDIGNTSALAGLFCGKVLKRKARLKTSEIAGRFLKILRNQLPMKRVEAAVISSVVPAASSYLRKAIPRSFGIKTHLIGRDILAPIANRYRDPSQVGIDRLMNAVAAVKICKPPLVIIDFGTAITFDVVSRRGEYLGGVIAPGIEISLDSLYQRTALLPKIRLAHPRALIGKDTVESIRVGCTYGIGGLCDRVLSGLKRALGESPRVIATGGYASFMRRYCKGIRRIEPDLTLEGIRRTYELFKKHA